MAITSFYWPLNHTSRVLYRPFVIFSFRPFLHLQFSIYSSLFNFQVMLKSYSCFKRPRFDNSKICNFTYNPFIITKQDAQAPNRYWNIVKNTNNWEKKDNCIVLVCHGRRQHRSQDHVECWGIKETQKEYEGIKKTYMVENLYSYWVCSLHVGCNWILLPLDLKS